MSADSMPALYHQNPSPPTVLLGLQRVWKGVYIRLHVHTIHIVGAWFSPPTNMIKARPPTNIRFGTNEGGINPSKIQNPIPESNDWILA